MVAGGAAALGLAVFPRPNISLGSRTLETAKIATGFWLNTVQVMDACTTPVSIATEPLKRVILSVELPASLRSVASVGWTGFTMN